MSRIRVIALVGAGAISSAAICSLYLAYTITLIDPDPPETSVLIPGADDRQQAALPAEVPPTMEPRRGAYLTNFLTDADPQVRTLAAWGLVTETNSERRQREILKFMREEKDPEVRLALYRYLHGQQTLDSKVLLELVRAEQEVNSLTWLAGCDLLAQAVKTGADNETLRFFDLRVVPALRENAVNAADMTCRLAAIIALRRAGTEGAVEALEEIAQSSADAQVVAAAASAIQLVAAAD